MGGWHMIGVKHDNKVLHDKIRMSDRGQYELLPANGEAAAIKQPVFADIPALVDHYGVRQEGMVYTLVLSNPIYDNHQLMQERAGYTTKVSDDAAAPSLAPKKVDYGAPAGMSRSGSISNSAYGTALPMAPELPDGISNPMYKAQAGADPGFGVYAAPKADGYLEV